ncbi:hypothetical protein ETR_16867 [Erwinia tracheiphila PSU-1]|nr:hypothetical protein ETR_16867 [Erwinia tracheiphila PSU-1]
MVAKKSEAVTRFQQKDAWPVDGQRDSAWKDSVVEIPALFSGCAEWVKGRTLTSSKKNSEDDTFSIGAR